jgi:hypothetical protein
MLQEIDISNDQIKSVIVIIIFLYCKTVLLNRNVKQFCISIKFSADFERFPIIKLNEYWCNNNLFCNVNKGNNKITELRTILQRES